MWKKNAPSSPAPAPPVQPRASAPPPKPSAPDMTTIGPSISIRGDITGDGDLLIEGRVQGAVTLRQHTVTVGPSAKVEADIFGKRICVDGEVEGDLYGEEVVIREKGRVTGNANAARVTLENGCSFRGAIDMQSSGKKQESAEKLHSPPAVGPKPPENRSEASRPPGSAARPTTAATRP